MVLADSTGVGADVDVGGVGAGVEEPPLHKTIPNQPSSFFTVLVELNGTGKLQTKTSRDDKFQNCSYSL